MIDMMRSHHHYFRLSIQLPISLGVSMRQILPPLALAMVLTACSLPAGSSMDDKIKLVQDTAVSVCSYLPAAASVSQVILATNATLDATLVTIGNGICAAVAEWQKSRGESQVNAAMMLCPMVNGICIEGKFVNKPQGGQ